MIIAVVYNGYDKKRSGPTGLDGEEECFPWKLHSSRKSVSIHTLLEVKSGARK